jgi:hypothetical protein
VAPRWIAVPSLPRVLLHLEGGAVLVFALWLYARSGASWGLFALLILAPDLSMLGYLARPRVGAAAYDAAHTYVWPILLAALGQAPLALIWAAHIGGDRLLGFGLKYPTRFQDTHLARV